jgi:hypothetical protein
LRDEQVANNHVVRPLQSGKSAEPATAVDRRFNVVDLIPFARAQVVFERRHESAAGCASLAL